MEFNKQMKKLAICILLITFSQWILGQHSYTLKQSYHNITWDAFVEAIEKNSDFSFYFQNEWTDSILIADLESGESLNEILQSILPGYGLHFYLRDKQVFIYPGSEIVSRLPIYDKYKVPLTQESSQNVVPESDDQYIKTRDVLKGQIIVIGNKDKYSGNNKCKIRGSIINQRDNEALVGATIYFNELEEGTISDVNGNFELSIKPGEYNVSVNHMAMKEKHYVLKVFSDGDLAIKLQDEIIELEEITISNDRFDNVKSMQMGANKISIKTMKEIPVVMGEKDVLKVAQMLPGVQNAGEGTSGFNVRGGSPDQNMFYINNISVYNTSHLFGFFTAFSPDVINDFSLYKNNVPSKYGGRIASVMEISTRDGNKERFFAQSGISPVTGHFSLEGPIIKGKSSFVTSFRSTYSDWILKRMKDEDLKQSNASFYDGTFEINTDINEKNQLKVFFYRSSDKFSLSSTNDYSYTNNGISGILKHRFASNLSSEFSIASSSYQFSTTNKENISEAYTQNYNILHNEIRADFIWLKNSKHRIEFGANSILYNLDRGGIIPYGVASLRNVIELGKEKGLESSLYLSDEIKLLPRFQLLIGLRYNLYSQLGPQEVLSYSSGLPKEEKTVIGETEYKNNQFIKPYSGLDPRLALNYSLSKQSSIKASYNRLHQYIFLLSNTMSIAPNDQWKLCDTHITPPVADQLSVGYYLDEHNTGLSMSVEVYQKWIQNSIDYKDRASFISATPIEQQLLQGKLNSKGVEFMLKKNTNKLTGWLSYTYSRSFMEMIGSNPTERINNGQPYPSNFDRPHSFNIVANLRASRRISISSNLVYSSGRPITLPVSIYYSEGQQLLLYSDRNQYRIPDYFRIDFSINIEGNLKLQKFGHSFWMLNIYNLNGRENAYSVYYKAEEGEIHGYKLSIFARPIVTLSWHFKLGNYAND